VAVPVREVERIAADLGPVAHETASPWRKRILTAGAIVLIGAIGIALFSGGFPGSLTVDSAKPFNAFDDWVIEHQNTNPLFVDFLVPLRHGVNSVFDGLVTGLSRMTWLGVVVAAAAIAGVLAGWRMAVLAAVGFIAMGVLGLWQASLETLALMLFAVTISLAIGVPVGIYAGRHPAVERILRPVLDAMQTVPAFSYLVPVVLLFSIGTTPALIATVLFALPPSIRLTSLGIRLVPEGALEVGRSFGTTSRQLLRKIQLPFAKPSIMLGVNQTIMMALGIVVIASAVGFKGLGREVLDGLQNQDVGTALAGGLAIVALAIVLDRVTYAWSARDHATRGKSLRVSHRDLPRWVVWVGAGVIVLIAVGIGRQILRQQDFPDGWIVSIAGPVNDVVAAITRTIGAFTGWLSDAIIRFGLDPIRDLLNALPWWLLCGGAGVLAWRVSRRIGLGILSFLLLAAIGVLGMWVDATDTLSQVIVAVVVAVALAIPLGIWSARSDVVHRILKPILDVMQTLPQFVYLVPVIALFHVGRVPGVIAALIYALPPGIRLTDAGIRQVPGETVEAARAFGATPNQVLRKVQLPLARPSILLGVNQTIMMVLSVVIIAGLVGGGGLGYRVVLGLNHDPGAGMVAGICILLLAIVIDRITQALGQGPGMASSRERTVGWSFGPSRWRSAAVQEGVSETPTGTDGEASTEGGQGEA
jgi:glycine betaine/proline transport system permease protein